MTSKTETCQDRVQENLQRELAVLRAFKAKMDAGEEGWLEESGRIEDYGLSFDYVAPDTFKKQPRGYCRWQLSWGGPSDEFRFYMDENQHCTRVQYWFLDWFDGANVKLTGPDFKLLQYFFDWFDGAGAVDAAIKKAKE